MRTGPTLEVEWYFMPPRNARNPPYLLLPRGIEFIASKNNTEHRDLARAWSVSLYTDFEILVYQPAFWGRLGKG